MDIFFKLRVFFWILVLSLWSILMYQFMRSDIFPALPKSQPFKNPFSHDSAPLKVTAPAPAQASAPEKRYSQSRLPEILKPLPLLPEGIKEIGTGRPEPVAETEKSRAMPPQDSNRISASWPGVPQGFTAAQTKHFAIYQEGGLITENLEENLEALHGNIMLDLIAFSPWTRDEKVLIYFLKTQSAYRKITGRPSWSAGASSLSRRIIYLYESEEAFGILAHELCHVYFDSFFNAGKSNPLWLSEGMATLVQSERGMSPPNWLQPNMQKLAYGAGFSLSDLMRVEDTAAADDPTVRLWYTQAYSVTRFLSRLKTADSFYNFAKMLRDGKSVHESLFRSYGMPFNRISALEHAWRYDLKTRGLTSLSQTQLQIP